MIKRLLFLLDKPQASQSHSFIASEQGIREWINHLPMAHGGRALRTIYQTLLEITGDTVPWERRYLFCTMLESTLERLLDGLQKQYATNVFPLTPRMLQAAELATHVHAFMLVSYKKILDGWQAENPDEDDEGPASFLQTKIVLRPRKESEHKGKIALLLALYHCERIVRIPRMLGIDYPTDLWLESHKLYSLAERRDWLDDPVKVDILPLPRSPLLAYKRILLTALLDMQHLSGTELAQVFEDMDNWAKAAEILHGAVRPIPESCNFYVRLEEDLPPYPIRNHKDPEQDCLAARCRLLKSDRIALRLEALSRPEAEADRLRTQTVKVLARSWWKAPMRRQRRHRSDDEVQVLLGISPVHRQLFLESGQQILGEPENIVLSSDHSASAVQSTFVDPYKLEGLRMADAWEMAEKGNEFIDTQIAEVRLEEERNRVMEYRPVACQVLDTSPTGYRLAIPHEGVRQVRAGDLIGVRSGEGAVWNLGSIRWISPAQRGRLTVGIQLHFPLALPLIFRIVHKGTRSDPIPGFLALLERLPVMILPSIKGLGDKTLEVEYRNRRTQIRLGGDRLMASNAFVVRNFAAGAILPGQPVDPQFGLAPVAELMFAATPRRDQGEKSEWERQFRDVFDSF